MIEVVSLEGFCCLFVQVSQLCMIIGTLKPLICTLTLIHEYYLQRVLFAKSKTSQKTTQNATRFGQFISHSRGSIWGNIILVPWSVQHKDICFLEHVFFTACKTPHHVQGQQCLQLKEPVPHS